ncbi:putative amidase signature domain-containing protein [Septoria linicola]|nr:putative amidase signature domain-containing protein [Septoria linicola]
MGDLSVNESARVPWADIVQQKRDDQYKKICTTQEAIATLPQQDIDAITGIDSVPKLASKIADGELKASIVAEAYISRAITSHQKTNCLTEIMFDQALEQARRLDEQATVGPLHGVPMTLKDQFDVEGFDTTLGYVGEAFKPATEDALLVKILKRAGAVFLAKTNLPQSIMWCETENPLFGLTTNPMNPKLTPGGSTGGEGALLHEHGSLVGWGTDIGGSVRIPTHMMGLYSLKPSSGRLPYLGCQVSTAGQEHVPSVIGPMARSLDSIETVTRTVIDAEPWNDDPTCHRLPWQQHIYTSIQSRPLIIGLLLDDGHVRPHPPIIRVLHETASKLSSAGHTIIPWNPGTLHPECIEVMDSYYTADGGEDLRRSIAAGGEPMIPHVEALVNRGKAISVYQYWQLNQRKRAVQAAYLKKWNETRDPVSGRKVDILLMPVMPHSAVKHRACKWVGYTKVWNLLDYTAVVLPGGKVDKKLDRKVEEVYEARNELDRWNWSLYDPEEMDGLPAGIQLVGQRLEEEKVLGAAKVVEEVLRNAS